MALSVSTRTLYVSLCLMCLIMFADIIDILTTNPSIQFAEEQFFSPNSSVINKIVTFRRNNIHTNMVPEVNFWNKTYIMKCERKCGENINLRENQVLVMFMIKSAINNFEKRDALRRTWAEEKQIDNFILKRTFILGACDYSNVIECRRKLDTESDLNNDLIEVDFKDAYYNNTLKTMHAFKWIITYCPQASFVLFVDDDYYVSPANLIRFLKQILYLNKSKDQIKLYAGFVQRNVSPIRDRTSKWYVSWQDYPYSVYPPFINAGAYLISQSALLDMYYASLYVKRFLFDDVYVSFLASKVSIEATHNDNFHRLSMPANYSSVIASHGIQKFDCKRIKSKLMRMSRALRLITD
ncbi:hypothetical protein B4U80_05135 [Leptotrombidium deliense]|uniref:Hexosyltransferase n=1 Tax=Leptotrombidium deliense TaxID=299467 RepID=A0A443SR10_9ACAR|nr:hypothetical protein B4U80_05135 [Leptotrombidium deliense]